MKGSWTGAARAAFSLVLAMTLAQLGIGAGKAALLADPLLDPGATERASISIVEVQANDRSFGCDMTPDGRFVVFSSEAANLVPFDTNGFSDIFVRDRQIGSTERVSVGPNGTGGNGVFFGRLDITPDGRYVLFSSLDGTLVPDDTNRQQDVFVRDRQAGVTTRVSVGANGVQGNSASFGVAISADGRLIAFESNATNLVSNDTNSAQDVFVRDRCRICLP